MTISAPAAAQEASPIGDWAGRLGEGAASLRVVIHILTGPEGELSGTLDSPDQGAFGIPLSGVTAADGKLSFTVPLIGGRYQASWNEAAREWQGTWEQNVGPTPLNLAVAPPLPPLPADWQLPNDAAIAEVIAARIAPRAGQGMVVGVLGPDGRRIVAGGPADAEPFGGKTLFEIGSISKVFTALILADMANKGEVSLDDPAAKYLPAGHRMPERNGRQITLRDLSTHMSGLPRLPDNMPYGDLADPYVDYTEAHMLEFLGRYELPRDIGAKYEYSNLGVGLLGYLLTRASGKDYDTLLRERITGPLAMDDTMVTLSSGRALAPAFDIVMRPAKPWNLPTLAGAGGIRSTAEDMLRFAAAALDPDSPIAAAMRTALAQRGDSGNPRVEQALGWSIAHPEPGRDVVMHGGGTGGYRSQLALEPAKGTAVVALTNAAVEPSTTDIAIHLLVGTPVAMTPPLPPPPPPPVARTEVTLPPAELDRVVGTYRFLPNLAMTVERRGEGLVATLTGAPRFPIFAEAPLNFFWRVVNAQAEFTTDESGTVTGVTLTQDGQSLTGPKVEP